MYSHWLGPFPLCMRPCASVCWFVIWLAKVSVQSQSFFLLMVLVGLSKISDQCVLYLFRKDNQCLSNLESNGTSPSTIQSLQCSQQLHIPDPQQPHLVGVGLWRQWLEVLPCWIIEFFSKCSRKHVWYRYGIYFWYESLLWHLRYTKLQSARSCSRFGV